MKAMENSIGFSPEFSKRKFWRLSLLIYDLFQSEHCEFSYDTPNRFYRECFYQLEQAEPISEDIFRKSKNALVKLDRNATVIYRKMFFFSFFIYLF